MGLKQSIACVIAVGLLVPGVAFAAADSPMIVADASAAVAKRFIPLASARQGMAGVRVVKPMRSDRAAMESGFMRLDRARQQIVRRQAPQSETVAKADAVNIIRPADAAVLDLFGESAPTEAVAPAVNRLGRTTHAWPLPRDVAARFTSGFGTRTDPFHGRQAFHGGIDLACPVGTTVIASADGVVTKVETGARYGHYVSVRHADGSESSYGHLSAQSVRVGQQVRQGQKLGEVGSTGRSTGPHLDYRLRVNGELVNPMTALRQPATTSTSRVANNSGVRIIR